MTAKEAKNGFRLALRILLYFSFGCYVLILLYLLFARFRGFLDLSLWDYIRVNTNLVPLRSILQYIRALSDQSMNIEIPVMNLFGNLLMFLPMGLYLPGLFRRLRRLGAFSVCMVGILFVTEAAQLLLRRGSFDIDDFILNMAGALSGFAAYRCVAKGWQKRKNVLQEQAVYQEDR
jgi:glycopeptide antibiotics resistance protein